MFIYIYICIYKCVLRNYNYIVVITWWKNLLNWTFCYIAVLKLAFSLWKIYFLVFLLILGWFWHTRFGKTRISAWYFMEYDAFLHDTRLHGLCTSCLITVWFWSRPLLGIKCNTNTDCATWRGRTQYGLAPACCSSSDGVGTGAGILGSTLWLLLRWIAWDLGVSDRAASACSPALECCHIWPVRLKHQCSCRNKQRHISWPSICYINKCNV